MSRLKVLIVEDEPAIAKYISNTLKNDQYEITALAFSSKRAIQELENNLPDVALLDINLDSSMDGIQIAELINEKHQIPFFFLTSYTNKEIINRAKHTRPLGYIVKPFSEKEILTTLEIALFNYHQPNKPKPLLIESINKKAYSPITEREFVVLKELYAGKGNQQIAQDNFVSINTVKTHLRNLFSKMNVRSRTELIAEIRKLVQ